MPAPPRKERADAARSRGATLGAARLFDEHGADGAATDQVAAAGGVGRGTLFRRFGDRSGLATALLTDREQALPGSRPARPAPAPGSGQRIGDFDHGRATGPRPA